MAKTSGVRYLLSREVVPEGNSTIPVMSSGLFRCGPALTVFYLLAVALTVLGINLFVCRFSVF